MRADECLFLVEKRSCSGHHRKDRIWPICGISAQFLLWCTAAFGATVW